MTYCIGLLLEAGLVMIADTRTNAGVDNFSSYKKLHRLADGPDRRRTGGHAGA
jgi:putative proteasome-type protease